ncbi:MAG: hypothetical protein U9Q90_09080 [Campylobacterota bacterium]|nr:hypothetical protein [Campylobacterota bacterium]
MDGHLSRLMNVVIKKYLVPISNRADTIVDMQLLGMLGSIIRAMIWIFAILLVLKLEGHTVVSFLTGMGIGSLALAFSSENIKKFFRGLSIFARENILESQATTNLEIYKRFKKEKLEFA